MYDRHATNDKGFSAQAWYDALPKTEKATSEPATKYEVKKDKDGRNTEGIFKGMTSAEAGYLYMTR